MVKGIETFENFFRDFSQEYVLIGGTACDLLMEEAGIEFRLYFSAENKERTVTIE